MQPLQCEELFFLEYVHSMSVAQRVSWQQELPVYLLGSLHSGCSIQNFSGRFCFAICNILGNPFLNTQLDHYSSINTGLTI